MDYISGGERQNLYYSGLKKASEYHLPTEVLSVIQDNLADPRFGEVYKETVSLTCNVLAPLHRVISFIINNRQIHEYMNELVEQAKENPVICTADDIFLSLCSVEPYMAEELILTIDADSATIAAVIAEEALRNDSVSVDEKRMRQYNAKAEAIFRKQFTKAADIIISRVYNTESMNGEQKVFAAKSKQMTEDLAKKQLELASQTNLSSDRTQAIAAEIIENITRKKMEAKMEAMDKDYIGLKTVPEEKTAQGKSGDTGSYTDTDTRPTTTSTTTTTTTTPSSSRKSKQENIYDRYRDKYGVDPLDPVEPERPVRRK